MANVKDVVIDEDGVSPFADEEIVMIDINDLLGGGNGVILEEISDNEPIAIHPSGVILKDAETRDIVLDKSLV